MPEVMYKSNNKMMKKSFPYNAKGVMEAKNFAKMTGGKMKMSKYYKDGGSVVTGRD